MEFHKTSQLFDEVKIYKGKIFIDSSEEKYFYIKDNSILKKLSISAKLSCYKKCQVITEGHSQNCHLWGNIFVVLNLSEYNNKIGIQYGVERVGDIVDVKKEGEKINIADRQPKNCVKK